MKLQALLISLAALLCATGHLPADPPSLQRVVPHAAQPGSTTTIQLEGSNLDAASDVWTSFPADVTLLESGKFELTIATDVPPQLGAIRVVSPAGVSNLKLLLLDPLSTDLATESESGQDPASAQLLQVGQATEGQVASESSWYCRLQPVAGKRVTIDIWARRLGSSLDPVIQVLDADGREIAFSDDEPGLDGDCRVSFLATSADPLTVKLRDVSFSGGGDFFFRIRTGEFPAVNGFYPPVLSHGEQHSLLPFPRQPGGRHASIQLQANPTGLIQWVETSNKLQAIGSIQLSSRRELYESMQQPAMPIKAVIGDAVSGWFSQRGEIDSFTLQVDRPMRVRIQAATRSLGSPSLLLMTLQTGAGKMIAQSELDEKISQQLDADLTSPGTYTVSLKELIGRHGSGQVYRVTIDEKTPSYQLAVAGDVFNAPAGGVVEIKLTVARDGYDGAISVSLAGEEMPGLDDAVIPDGKNEAVVKLTLPADWEAGSIHHLQLVGKGDGGEYETLAEQDALKFARGNLGRFDGFVSDEQTAVTNFAEYDMEVLEAGQYQLHLRYAALQSRPAVLQINGELVHDDAMKNTSGGWVEENQRWHLEGVFKFQAGKNVIRIQRDGTVSHLSQLKIARAVETTEIAATLTQSANCRAAIKQQLGGMAHPPRNLTAGIIIGVTVEEE
jgi:hypothetical protein